MGIQVKKWKKVFFLQVHKANALTTYLKVVFFFAFVFRYFVIIYCSYNTKTTLQEKYLIFKN